VCVFVLFGRCILGVLWLGRIFFYFDLSLCFVFLVLVCCFFWFEFCLLSGWWSGLSWGE